MNPKSHRFPGGIAAATIGAGATAAVLLLSPAISSAGTEEPDDTVEATTSDDDATADSDATLESGPGGGPMIIIRGGGGQEGPIVAGGPGGPGGPGGGHDRGPREGRPGRFDGELIAEAIGIDVDTLAEELRNGSTVAEIAEANDVDPQAVIDALVASYTERVTAWIEGEQPAAEPEDTATTEPSETTETTVA